MLKISLSIVFSAAFQYTENHYVKQSFMTTFMYLKKVSVEIIRYIINYIENYNMCVKVILAVLILYITKIVARLEGQDGSVKKRSKCEMFSLKKFSIACNIIAKPNFSKMSFLFTLNLYLKFTLDNNSVNYFSIYHFTLCRMII